MAQEVQNGNGRITTGKVPLSFALYKEICGWMLEDDSPSGRFAHTFLVLSWNLACRSSNTKTIHYHHLAWAGDALQVYFAHMKNDQTGDRPRDPRHIYANPYNPTVCPLLSLTMYLLVTPPTSSSALFPGSDQYNRYNKYLRNLLERKEVYVMRNYGVDVGEIGAHSARKGAATYMTSGYVGGPMQQAVNIRCGWRMSGVTDTYCRYEAAGDQYCGRVVSGLPLFSFRFAVLPPRFILDNPELQVALDRLVLTLFPDLSADLWLIVKYGIASLALREEWLRVTMNPTNALFQCAIFWNGDYQRLKGFVELKLGVGDSNLEVDQIRSNDVAVTGIPSHTVLLASQRDMVLQQRELLAKSEEIPGVIRETIESANPVSSELRNVVAELQTVGDNLISRMQNMQVQDPTHDDNESDVGSEASRVRDTHNIQLHYHNGSFIRIDPGFIFPKKCSLRDIFFRFYLHDEVNNVPPLKLLDCASVRHIRRGKSTLSDLRFLMNVLNEEAGRQGILLHMMRNQVEASAVFERVKGAVYKYDTKSKRKETLKWMTWATKCRRGINMEFAGNRESAGLVHTEEV